MGTFIGLGTHFFPIGLFMLGFSGTLGSRSFFFFGGQGAEALEIPRLLLIDGNRTSPFLKRVFVSPAASVGEIKVRLSVSQECYMFFLVCC